MEREDVNLSVIGHLVPILVMFVFPFGNVIVTFIIYSVNKNKSIWLKGHLAESFNLQVTYTIYTLLLFVLYLGVFFVSYGTNELEALAWCVLGLLLFVQLAMVVLAIYAAVKAYSKYVYRHPMIIHFVNRR